MADMMAANDPGAEALPNEVVITEIISRLPAKSVGRFRCVSRGWSAMLSSDYFVDLHHQRANRPDHPRLLLTAYSSTSSNDYLYSWQPGGGDGAVENLMRDDFGLQYVVTSKPCRGLILLRRYESCGGYYVVNPSSGETLSLPDSEVPFKMAYKISRGPVEPPRYLRVSYGLGYCMATKEYKVVRLFSKPGAGGLFTPTICEVFVLGAAATGYWRPSAEIPPSSCSVMQWNPAVFLHGYLHFLCFDGGIVTFSIGDETFGSLPPPPGFSNAATTSVLTELDGRLCVCHGEPDSDDPLVLCVYYDKKAQWENLCRIDRTAWPESERMLLKSLYIAPLCVYYAATGALKKKIMFGTGSCKVFAVDSSGGGDPEILLTPEDSIIGSCDDEYLPVIGIYEESLVPLSRTIEDMIFSTPKGTAWFNILKCMPARSLSELRMVCREWRGMITSDCFIRSHAIHANLKMKRSPHIMFIIDPSFGCYEHLEDCIRDPSLLILQPPEFVVCSQPCHGLNVGNWSRTNYFICNPIMRYFQRIKFDDSDETFFAGRVGLGYNTERDNHILVQINYKEKNLETRSYELMCSKKHVNNEQWFPIDPPPRPPAPIQPTYLDGKIYWIVEPNLGPDSARCEIIAFNVKTEEFEVLQGPPCAHGVGHMTILELYGTLCVSYSSQSRNTIDLWMMKDAGIWLMEYHIVFDKLSEKAAPLAVDPIDGRILLNTGLSLVYYDPKTAAFETLVITEGYPDHPDHVFYPIVCHESLVCPLHYDLEL